MNLPSIFLFDLSFPLSDPILIFSLLLFIILFAPILLNKFKIPHLIGLIIAGALIGPNGFNLMLRDSSIELFGTVGLQYIMFLAGLEIDLVDFKKNSAKSLVFGVYTFVIPMTLGILGGVFLLNYSLPTAILLASMFASHTLIAYPLVSKLGVAKNRAVNITVGGTMITDTLALLVLAGIVGMSTGNSDAEFWIKLGIGVVLAASIIIFVFPIVGRWFFKNFDDNVSQYIFVLAIVFLSAFLAEVAGIEAIIGSFLAGLALNRLIPHTSPLMNRIEFVGNALFIPFFLIGVGMLINFGAFIQSWSTLQVATVMTVIALSAKFIAAWLTQKTFRFSVDERRLIFGLSSAQAAATLAVVLVGYRIVLNQADIDAAAALGEVIAPVRLLDDYVLNGTILMILVTCTVSSFIAQKGAKNIAMAEASASDNNESTEVEERVLISVSNEETVDELVNLSLMVKSKKNTKGLYALNIITDNNTDGAAEKNGKKIIEKAKVAAASADIELQELLRYDINIVNGISHVVKENKITDLILGLHAKKGISDSFLGHLTEGILTKCNVTTLIYKPNQPIGTLKRHLVIVPDRAEREIGFPFWLIKIWNIARNTGAKIVFYGSEESLTYIKEVHEKHPIDAEFIEFDDWNDFLILARDIKPDDNLIIIMSRREQISYKANMKKIPTYLNKYFKDNNFILAYPMQEGVGEGDNSRLKSASVLDSIKNLDEIGKTIVGLFLKK